MISTSPKNNNRFHKLLAVAAALCLWQAAAALLHEPILLASPVQVGARLLTLWKEPGFFPAVFGSAAGIGLGFLLGFLTGAFLGVVASRYRLVETLLWPYVTAFKSVPVASFIILALIWLSTKALSVFIVFLIVFPVIYTNVLTGLRETDTRLVEMAKVFRVPCARRLRGIYMPQLKPYLLSASSVALGMAWKAGVAAEVIGVPKATIGEMLYDAKIYLATTDLLAWTIIIVVMSAAFEKGLLFLIRLALERGSRL